ncbi:putative dsRNA-binding protein [Riemerella anatipestifer]|uniref:putative dsRNA-binding protein n=1 Tax=Riemerella anatipestifer TaxID=34085 RepID=UPI00069AB56C|nr:putative dsRNA-binding protein [Riemerella anatipestifer]
MTNPIVKLAETCQKIYRENIITRVVKKEGLDHCPTITVEIELPDRRVFRASVENQKVAKQKAAKKALAKLR